MRSALQVLVLLPMLLLSACNGGDEEELAQPATVSPGHEFDLRYGATVEVDDLTLEFSQLVEESRCPASVSCVWQGNARIILTAHRGRAVHLLELNTNPAFATFVVFEGYSIELRDLQPYPGTPTTLPQPVAYVATLFVER